MVFTQVTQLHFLSYRYDEMVVGSLVSSCALPVRQNRGKHHYLFEKIIRKKFKGILFFFLRACLTRQTIYLSLLVVFGLYLCKTKHVIIGN